MRKFVVVVFRAEVIGAFCLALALPTAAHCQVVDCDSLNTSEIPFRATEEREASGRPVMHFVFETYRDKDGYETTFVPAAGAEWGPFFKKLSYHSFPIEDDTWSDRSSWAGHAAPTKMQRYDYSTDIKKLDLKSDFSYIQTSIFSDGSRSTKSITRKFLGTDRIRLGPCTFEVINSESEGDFHSFDARNQGPDGVRWYAQYATSLRTVLFSETTDLGPNRAVLGTDRSSVTSIDTSFDPINK